MNSLMGKKNESELKFYNLYESEKRDSAKREETSLVAQRLGTRLPMQETRV